MITIHTEADSPTNYAISMQVSGRKVHSFDQLSSWQRKADKKKASRLRACFRTVSLHLLLFVHPTKRGVFDLPFVAVALDPTGTITDQSYVLLLHIVKSNVDTIRCFHSETICLNQKLFTV